MKNLLLTSLLLATLFLFTACSTATQGSASVVLIFIESAVEIVNPF